MTMMSAWRAFVVNGVVCFALGAFLGYPSGMVSMKWETDKERRRLREENHELAESGRRLAAAAYVCMDHCGTPTCEPKAEGKP